jgi:hypothetical protein
MLRALTDRVAGCPTNLCGRRGGPLGQIPLAVREKVHVRIQIGEELIALLGGGATELERLGDVVRLRCEYECG